MRSGSRDVREEFGGLKILGRKFGGKRISFLEGILKKALKPLRMGCSSVIITPVKTSRLTSLITFTGASASLWLDPLCRTGAGKGRITHPKVPLLIHTCFISPIQLISRRLCFFYPCLLWTDRLPLEIDHHFRCQSSDDWAFCYG
jgi:hypothetical protein